MLFGQGPVNARPLEAPRTTTQWPGFSPAMPVLWTPLRLSTGAGAAGIGHGAFHKNKDPSNPCAQKVAETAPPLGHLDRALRRRGEGGETELLYNRYTSLDFNGLLHDSPWGSTHPARLSYSITPPKAESSWIWWHSFDTRNINNFDIHVSSYKMHRKDPKCKNAFLKSRQIHTTNYFKHIAPRLP